MDDTSMETLHRTLAQQEQALGPLASDCARLLVLPLSPSDRSGLERALIRLSQQLQQVALTANRIRFDRSGASPAERLRSLNEVDARTRRLSQVLMAIRRIMSARPRPLYPPAIAPRSLWSEQAMASDRVQVALNRVVNPEAQDAAATDLGCWPDIPLPPSRFLHHAHAAYRVALAQRRPAPLRFLDVGCGSGLKVLLAGEFFDRTDGLEYDPGYATTAERVLAVSSRRPSRVIPGDALTFDGYDNYDVIYFYQPMKSPEGLVALERRIAGRARPGTILIAPYSHFTGRAESFGCGAVEGAVYLAATPGRAARAIARRARHAGIDIPRPEDEVQLPGAGYLRTLVEACRRCGHEIL